MNIKLWTFTLIIASLIAFAVIPKTRAAKSVRMSEGLYRWMHRISLLCGVGGLAVTFIMGDGILETHFFELILVPVFLVFLYSLLIIRIGKTEEIYDEKQEMDMTKAAAFTLPFSFGGMFILYAMFREGIFGGTAWFPLFVFWTISIYSGSVLVLFKK